MKAAVLTGVGRVEIRDVPRPPLKNADDVLLKTTRAGLCGSDLHYFIADRVGGEKVAYPAVVGHECAAVVEAVGRKVTRFKPGDRVTVEPAISCGACDQCRSGRLNTCRKIRFLGHPGEMDGCLAEYFVMPERNCLWLPENISPAQAVLTEPFSIALHAVQFWPGDRTQTMAVLGTGPIGLCVLIAARLNGVHDLFATDKVKERTEAARRAGAPWAGNPDREDIVRAILTQRPLGLDAVFECCGDQAALDQAVELLKPGGTLVFVGIPLEERISFPSRVIRRKEIRIQNVRRQNRCAENAIELVACRRVDIDFLATHTFPLEEAQAAFETAAYRKAGALKTMIAF